MPFDLQNVFFLKLQEEQNKKNVYEQISVKFILSFVSLLNGLLHTILFFSTYVREIWEIFK
jgi:hypothetical protein